MKFVLKGIILLFCTILHANTIPITQNTDDINILNDSYYFIDKNDTYDANQILHSQSIIFKKIEKNFVNYGYMFSDTLWIKFTLKNPTQKKILKYLVVDNPNIDILNLYYMQDKKSKVIKNGIFHRKTFHNELAFKFPLVIKPHEVQTYYLKVKVITHSLHFSLHIKSYEKFKNDDMKQQLGFTIFFSILFVVIFYNLIVYFYSKEKIYFYYALFVMTMFVHQLSLRGMIAYFIPPDFMIEQAYMPPYYMAMVMISVILFVRKFLNLYKYKKIYFPFKMLIIYILFVILFTSKDNYLLNYLTPAAVLEVLYLEFIGAYLYWVQKEKYAKYFFPIWSISLFGILLTILYYEGIYTHPIPFLMEGTFLIEILFFSIILSSYIKDLKIEKLQKHALLLEQSKMASMGAMLQNISHQWRQPLSEINSLVMKIDADNYENKLTQKTLEDDLEAIETITSYLSNTIETFSDYSKQHTKTQTTSLEKALQESLNIVKSSLQDVKLNITVKKSTELQCNLNEIMQVLLIILNNAINALLENNIKNKKISITIFQKNNQNLLSIEDNAGGIKEEHILQIFEPYFTTKFQSQGVGIGLYIAKKIMHSYNGDIIVSNTDNGAKFTIIL